MIIKEIHIEKSRTIEVAGLMSRDKYRKITVGLTASLTKADYKLNVEGEFEKHRDQLSRLVDESMSIEINKLSKKKNG